MPNLQATTQMSHYDTPLFDYGEDVALPHYKILLALDLDLGPGVFAIENLVALLDLHLLVLGAFAGGEHGSAEGFLLCGVGDYDTCDCCFLGRGRLDEHPVSKRFDFHWWYMFLVISKVRGQSRAFAVVGPRSRRRGTAVRNRDTA